MELTLSAVMILAGDVYYPACDGLAFNGPVTLSRLDSCMRSGEGPPIAAPNTGDETPTSQGEDGNDTGKESEGVALQPATHSEGADEENAADSPAETTVNLQSQMQSPEEKSTAMSSPESPHPSTHPAAGVDEPAGSPYDPVPIVPGPPDIISASPGSAHSFLAYT